MSRESIEERFLDILDGSLPPEEEQRLRAEIAADPLLSRSFEAYRNVMELERKAADTAHRAPGDLAARIGESLLDRQPVLEWLGGLLTSRRFASSAATLAVLVLVVKLAWESPESRQGSSVLNEPRPAAVTRQPRLSPQPSSPENAPAVGAPEMTGLLERSPSAEAPKAEEPAELAAKAAKPALDGEAMIFQRGTSPSKAPARGVNGNSLSPLFEDERPVAKAPAASAPAAAASAAEDSYAGDSPEAARIARSQGRRGLTRSREALSGSAEGASALLDKALPAPPARGSAPQSAAPGTLEEAANRFNHLAGEAPVTYEAVPSPLREGAHLALFSVAASDAAEIVVRPVAGRVEAYSVLGQTAGGGTSSGTRIRARDGRATVLVELSLSDEEAEGEFLQIEARAGRADGTSQIYRVELATADVAPGIQATSDLFRAVIAAVHALKKERDPDREPYEYSDILEVIRPLKRNSAISELISELEEH